MTRFHHTPPKTIECDVCIEGATLTMDAVAEYCTNTGQIVGLRVEWHPMVFNINGVARPGPRKTQAVDDLDAFIRVMVPLAGDGWVKLSDDELAELLRQHAEDTEADWADWQNDMSKEAAE